MTDAESAYDGSDARQRLISISYNENCSMDFKEIFFLEKKTFLWFLEIICCISQMNWWKKRVFEPEYWIHSIVSMPTQAFV